MKRFLAALGVLALLSWLAPSAAFAQTAGTTKVVGTCGTQTYVAGKMQYPTQDTTGAACVAGTISATNPSVGLTGTTAPTSATQDGGKTAAGNLVADCVDTVGVLCAPQAGTANRVLTATTLTLNTDTVICPTATNPVTTELYFTTAGVGVGVNGQTLTTATPGATTTNSPDFAIGVAGTLYTFPVGPSNAVHGYGAAGVVRCIQTLRQ